MLSGQIAEGDLLTRIQNYKIPAYGYNLAEVCMRIGRLHGCRQAPTPNRKTTMLRQIH